eukprot:scaffold19.g1800.t1
MEGKASPAAVATQAEVDVAAASAEGTASEAAAAAPVPAPAMAAPAPAAADEESAGTSRSKEEAAADGEDSSTEDEGEAAAHSAAVPGPLEAAAKAQEEQEEQEEDQEREAAESDEEEEVQLLGSVVEQLRQVLSIGEETGVRLARAPVLASRDIEGIAALIKAGRSRIICMCGAGISVNAGIPDFRSPGSGLYHRLEQYDLPYPQAVFEIDFFKRNPKPFFVLSKELAPGKFKPTPTHYFMRLLHDKGLLLRCYTQNIDSLERIAGLPSSMIVPAHGNWDTASCIRCKHGHDPELMLKAVEAGEPFRCMRKGCNGLVKPDIVFFGENLPVRFWNLVPQDFPQARADLLIVMGTSLVVHPFAGLVDKVGLEVPRLLINKEKAGESDLESRLLGLRRGFDFSTATGWRDALYLGDCDEGVRALCGLLGWEAGLDALVAGASVQPLSLARVATVTPLAVGVGAPIGDRLHAVCATAPRPCCLPVASGDGYSFTETRAGWRQGAPTANGLRSRVAQTGCCPPWSVCLRAVEDELEAAGSGRAFPGENVACKGVISDKLAAAEAERPKRPQPRYAPPPARLPAGFDLAAWTCLDERTHRIGGPACLNPTCRLYEPCEVERLLHEISQDQLDASRQRELAGLRQIFDEDAQQAFSAIKQSGGPKSRRRL